MIMLQRTGCEPWNVGEDDLEMMHRSPARFERAGTSEAVGFGVFPLWA